MYPIANNDSIPSYHHWITYPWWLPWVNRDQFCCWFCRVDELNIWLFIKCVWFVLLSWILLSWNCKREEWGEWVKCDWRLARIQDIISNSDKQVAAAGHDSKELTQRENMWVCVDKRSPFPCIGSSLLLVRRNDDPVYLLSTAEFAAGTKAEAEAQREARAKMVVFILKSC